MKADRIRDEFESLAEKLGYTIRYEKGDFKGDACRIKSERVIIINRLIPVTHQNYAFSRIFATEDLSQLSVLPVLRSMIEEVGGGAETLFDQGEQDA
ncbi:MAG: hypothetical protein HN995_00355 [Candidatus Marinimicrobia bacterium]|jgi:hypothetical protein|nr:hypothetical protein [Candidatus Neomarinimicrobiota bacterium]MBT3575422.1 hypothetical protein [Candidatus Neomarinimicrobiota bacterium]MBT3678683.1 hypothetical protein [Candidatus Neomarinimicrobiota bacterium]MBT3951566.1 hypothetical protein [Candidatus Neomarinimicrobiota bacterium]MBT4252019.1 hypothetical protein [Candidatus Neomarinimicrobiota bacterium]